MAIRHVQRRLRRRLAIVRRTGRWRPGQIRLAASGHLIHIDPRDPRGWEIVRGLGRGHQPPLMARFAQVVEALEPDLVVDVGANYGEMVLSARYPEGCRVVAVEANPVVADLLARSLAAHPDGSRLELARCLASDADGGTEVLRIDPTWSGSASVVLDEGRDDPAGDALRSVEVPVRTVDALVGAPGRRTFLKIDAEGWEGHVLDGATATLGDADSVVVLAEFGPEMLRRAGTDPHALFTSLTHLGSAWVLADDGTAQPALTAPEAQCDVLVVSDPVVAAALDLPW